MLARLSKLSCLNAFIVKFQLGTLMVTVDNFCAFVIKLMVCNILKTSGMTGRWVSGSVSGIRESVSCENGI